MEFPLAWGHWRRPINFSADLRITLPVALVSKCYLDSECIDLNNVRSQTLISFHFEKRFIVAEYWEQYWWSRILRRVLVKPNFGKNIGSTEFWGEYWWSRILGRILVEPNFEESIGGTEFWEEYWWSFPSCFRHKIQVTKQTLSYVDSDIRNLRILYESADRII